MTEIEKITRDEIRDIQPGETRTYRLPTVPAIFSARSAIYQMQSWMDCKFTLQADYDNRTLTVTRVVS